MDINDLKLFLQRALLGEISSRLRGITCAIEGNVVRVRCYFHGEIKDEDMESMSCVESMLLADYHPDICIDLKVERLDYPEPLASRFLMAWIYRRKEPALE